MSGDDLLTGQDDDSTPETQTIHHQCVIPREKSGMRLDQVAAELFPDYSRARLQQWIKDGALTVDGKTVKPKVRLTGNEKLELIFEEQPRGEWTAEDVPLDIVYCDDSILVVNKPVGLVVHPAAGNYTGTLLNGLLFHFPDQIKLARAGIVHRLDKDTSGLMVVARTEKAQNALVQQLQARTVSRQYQALVLGHLTSSGVVDAAIGRHPTQRTKMAVVPSGKQAVTHYQPIEHFGDFTLVNLKLETGRTHQIRVHMAHLGYPLIGDQTYGRKFPPILLRDDLRLQALADFPRQALHAWRLGLEHPETGEHCSWTVPMVDDIQNLLDLLYGLAE